MILVIDGYNLLNEMYRQKLVSESQLRSFIKKIANYVAFKGHKAIIAFDGYNKFDIYSQDYKNISLYYSKNISADDYIKEYIFMNKSENVAVVSSDLEIYRSALSLGIVTIKSSAFLYLMNGASSGSMDVGNSTKNSATKLKGPIYKSSAEENSELDELMAESGNVLYYKLEENMQHTKESISQKKLSKSERKILTIRKKL